MIITTIYEKDAVKLYNEYFYRNDGNIPKTLRDLEKDEKLPTVFIRYYGSHEDFMKKFDISEWDYYGNCTYKWLGKNITNIK